MILLLYIVSFFWCFNNLNSSPVPYIDGILEQVNITTKHPLSNLYVFRENSSVSYQHFPVMPDCSNILDVHEEQYPATVTIWKVDQESTLEWGLVLWTEKIHTRCSFGFWGNYKGSEIGRIVVETTTLLTPEQIKTFSNTTAENEVLEVDNVDYKTKYNCWYSKYEVDGWYNMRYVKYVRIVRFPYDSIKNPPGSWIVGTSHLYHYNLKFLYVIRKGESHHCPLTVYSVRAGVLSKSMKDNVIVSIPTKNLQFAVSPKANETKCIFSDATYDIVQSLGGYLLSLDTRGGNWRGPWGKERSTRSTDSFILDITTIRFKRFVEEQNLSRPKRGVVEWEFSSYLRTSTEYAQLRYEQDFVIRQINRNFGLLQKTICESQLMKWIMLQPPHLARKVANYITGDIYSLGDINMGVYKVQHTSISLHFYELVFPIVIKYGMYQIVSNESNAYFWAEPVTGIIFKDPVLTHFSMSAAWLPGKNGSGVVPTTGKVLLPETTIEHLDTIKQSEAFSSKSLYSMSELTGSSEEFQMYRTTSPINEIEKGSFSPWASWGKDIVTTAVVGIFIALLIPSILKLIKHIIEKGEDKIEEATHLNRRKTKSSRLTKKSGVYG